MNIGLFGGTFDPIHRGHLTLAHAAAERFSLGQVHVVPANVPPHKEQPVASFYERYAMVALATAGDKRFLPSLLEAPPPVTVGDKRKPQEVVKNYSIDT